MLHIIISDGVTISKAADRVVSSAVAHLIRHGVYYFGSYDRCSERQNNVKKNAYTHRPCNMVVYF